MPKPIPLPKRELEKFCDCCLNEPECFAANKCLFNAGYAGTQPAAPVVPIKNASRT